MKRLLMIILACGIVTVDTGCSKNNKKERLRSGRGGRATSDGRRQADGRNLNSIDWAGIVQSSDTVLADFVSGWMDPADLGRTDVGGDTGVYFGGYVVTSGRFNPSASGSYNLDYDDSRMQILIWDEFSGRQNEDGEIIPGIVVDRLKLIDGYVDNGEVYLAFQDELGTIELEGQVGGSSFSGTMYYNNRGSDGFAGGSGTLGRFQIHPCDFFLCD